MSAPHTNNTPAGDAVAVLPEDERLPVGKIAVVSVVTLVAFAIGILWTVQIMHAVEDANEASFGARVEPSEIGKAEIGIVDQQLFAVERRAADFAQIKLQSLQSAGWVSRKEQIVHIPIERAMQAYVEGKRLPRTGGADALPGITGDVTPQAPGTPQSGGEGARSPGPGTHEGHPHGQPMQQRQGGQQGTPTGPGKTQGPGGPSRGNQQRGPAQGGAGQNTNAPTR